MVRTTKQKIWVEGVSYELQVRGGGGSGGGGGGGGRLFSVSRWRLDGGRPGRGRMPCCPPHPAHTPYSTHPVLRVQEIYGLEQSVAASRADADDPDSEERLCVICLVNERDTTVLPCRHM